MEVNTNTIDDEAIELGSVILVEPRGSVILVEPDVVMADVVVVALSISESLEIKRIYSEKGRRSISHYKSEIQEIGRKLNETKGMPLMLGFLKLYIPQKDWRTVDVMWNGIGQWQC